MAFVLVSCALADKDRATPMFNALRNAGHQLWIAPLDGSDWRAGLGEVTRSVDAIVLIMSRAALDEAAKGRQPANSVGFAGLLNADAVETPDSGARMGRPSSPPQERNALLAALSTAEGGWTAHEAYVALAPSKVISLIIDARLAPEQLPAPLRHLQILALPPEQHEQEQTLTELSRALDQKEARQTRGGKVSAAAYRAPPAPRAAPSSGSLAVAVSFVALVFAGIAAFGAITGAGGGQGNAQTDAQLAALRQDFDRDSAFRANLNARADALQQSGQRQAALLTVLSADIYSPNACTDAREIDSLRLTEQGRSDPYTVQEGQGIYQVAREVYGANPHRVANLIFFANRDYFCAGNKPHNPNLLNVGQSLRIPKLDTVLPELSLANPG